MKVIIIGAGISGLAAGIYAQSSGFDTEIIESHNIPGGFCTSWRRQGYLFEGGMHWLTGSKDGTALNKLWRETGAIDDSTAVHLCDPFAASMADGKIYSLYRDAERTRQELLNAFPEDAKEINKLFKTIASFSEFAMPIGDVKKLKIAPGSEAQKVNMAKMLKAMPKLMKYGKMSMGDFCAKFENKKLGKLLTSIIPGDDYAATSLIMTLVTFMIGDGGYLKGGSLGMANRMAEKYHSLGGSIRYKTMVEKVLVNGGKATGVIAGGEEYRADAVIIASDTRMAIDKLFDEPVREAWAEDMRRQVIPQMCNFISLGVEDDLSSYPETVGIQMDEPVEIAGQLYHELGLNNYAGYEGYAPDGCTACTAVYTHDCYNYWKQARDDGTYEDKKRMAGEKTVEAISRYIPDLAGKIKVMDVATPLTYERYCGAYRGSWMSIMKAGDSQHTYPAKMESIANVYNSGHRMMIPGGMPVAVNSGRTAVQHLCLDNDMVFCAPA